METLVAIQDILKVSLNKTRAIIVVESHCRAVELVSCERWRKDHLCDVVITPGGNITENVRQLFATVSNILDDLPGGNLRPMVYLSDPNYYGIKIFASFHNRKFLAPYKESHLAARNMKCWDFNPTLVSMTRNPNVTPLSERDIRLVCTSTSSLSAMVEKLNSSDQ